MNKLVLKAQRLLTAIYLVTDFVRENETLRSRLRECAIELLSDLSKREREKAFFCTDELLALIGVGQAIGLISAMNASILENELNHLNAFIKEETSNSVTKDFFGQLDVETLSKRGRFIGQGVLKKGESLAQKSRTKFALMSRSSNLGRRQNIIDLVKKKTPLTVRDVASVIKDCSEKTLQRELLAMVREGVLRKEGERRWSRYFLSPTSALAD
ncbi:hypothetical protein A2761_00340 [Candidatus Kaiserbacteria bacterium RIFCSPHIGHO2_01_FULL_51_33]|uniref:HTH deoR-type domain-containing protein n=1 Tax=Candidatus Kaiserbacteria bacterium RIFCSPLOWO2_01_FULL_51_21 TaxID=1798508 RepID=A0A1F6ECH0_9BACT|nr:MAG: hypothetical protein A2761_00340 [Candidatus Kaiserbacteria bacterium RIFCSPHIGHO2_01_FULL_51_33]OGG71351.1 MAG: hypothetical protein A3A35_00070 [Candidatus Kaiserbacteria bacterium RIFCSPLOWO2_01_FULL_51_21]